MAALDKKRLIRSPNFPLILCLMISLFSPAAYAYLDPGTASYWIQMLVAFVIAALYTGRIYWSRVRIFIAKLFKRKSE